MRTVITVRQRKTGKQINEYQTTEDAYIEIRTYEKDE